MLNPISKSNAADEEKIPVALPMSTLLVKIVRNSLVLEAIRIEGMSGGKAAT